MNHSIKILKIFLQILVKFSLLDWQKKPRCSTTFDKQLRWFTWGTTRTPMDSLSSKDVTHNAMHMTIQWTLNRHIEICGSHSKRLCPQEHTRALLHSKPIGHTCQVSTTQVFFSLKWLHNNEIEFFLTSKHFLVNIRRTKANLTKSTMIVSLLQLQS